MDARHDRTVWRAATDKRPGTRSANLFLVYISSSVNQINVILSTDGGVTFSAPVTAGTAALTNPRSLWATAAGGSTGSKRKYGRAWGASDGSRCLGDPSTHNSDPVSEWQLRRYRPSAWPERGKVS